MTVPKERTHSCGYAILPTKPPAPSVDHRLKHTVLWHRIPRAMAKNQGEKEEMDRKKKELIYYKLGSVVDEP